jgi:hypothetical protein
MEPGDESKADTRYGESLVREVLGATFISEEKSGEPDATTESDVTPEA